jgi:hypothetical protein
MPTSSSARFPGCGFGSCRGLRNGRLHLPGKEHDECAGAKKGDLRHLRDQSECDQYAANNPKRAGGLEHLLTDIRPQREIGTGTGNDDAASHRHEQ